MTPEELQIAATNQKIELWKTAVNTQQHFNTLQLQLRNYALTLYLAILTAVGYAIKESMIINIWGCSTSMALLVCIAGLVVVFAFYFSDWGYFQLLKGAVQQGIEIENSLDQKSQLPEAGLAKRIGEFSSKKRFLGFFPKGAATRLHWFYGFLIIGLILIAAFAQCAAHFSIAADSKRIQQPTQSIEFKQLVDELQKIQSAITNSAAELAARPQPTNMTQLQMRETGFLIGIGQREIESK